MESLPHRETFFVYLHDIPEARRRNNRAIMKGCGFPVRDDRDGVRRPPLTDVCRSDP